MVQDLKIIIARDNPPSITVNTVLVHGLNILRTNEDRWSLLRGRDLRALIVQIFFRKGISGWIDDVQGANEASRQRSWVLSILIPRQGSQLDSCRKSMWLGHKRWKRMCRETWGDENMLSLLGIQWSTCWIAKITSSVYKEGNNAA